MRRLWRLAGEPSAKVSVIATLRVDFLGEGGDIIIDDTGRRLDSITYDQQHRVFIAWLAAQQLRAAIEGPAQRVGIVLEAGLTSRMLEAVGADPGALPLLSYTLDLLWLRRDGRTLTQAAYEAVGQVAGALSQHADTLLAKLSTTENQIAHRLFVRLVHLGDGAANNSRQRVPIARLRPADAAAVPAFSLVVKNLVDARLLLRTGEEREQTLEVAHEALIRSWPQLQKWLQADRELLAQLAKLEALLVQWRDHKVLLTGEQLSFAERVAKVNAADFPQEARRLLVASQNKARQIRALKRLATLAIVCSTLIFAYLFVTERRANEHEGFARRELVRLIDQSGAHPSTAEMLRTLARLRIELELREDLALAAINQAAALEPHNPHVLADQAEYLLAAGKLDEVEAPARQALLIETAKEPRLHIALVAWAAARLLGEKARTQQIEWAKIVQLEYDLLPPDTQISSMLATSHLLLIRHRLTVRATSLTDVLEVFGLLHAERSTARKKILDRLLAPQS